MILSGVQRFTPFIIIFCNIEMNHRGIVCHDNNEKSHFYVGNKIYSGYRLPFKLVGVEQALFGSISMVVYIIILIPAGQIHFKTPITALLGGIYLNLVMLGFNVGVW